MKFFDLHIKSAFSEGRSSLEQLSAMAKELGFKGICFAEYYQGEEHIKKIITEIQKMKEKVGIDIFLGFEARTSHELAVLIAKRKKFDVLLVEGGDLRLNRLAVETPEVDILTHPEHERQDSGLNHTLVKLAEKNEVAIEFNFREILTTNGRTRSRILMNMRNNLMLAKKLHAQIIISCGAVSEWELKSPQELISFGTELGLELDEAKAAISKIPENILTRSRERRDKMWIAPGVKVIK
jgi:ribonuclease P/MRP protein subunit RPP1